MLTLSLVTVGVIAVKDGLMPASEQFLLPLFLTLVCGGKEGREERGGGVVMNECLLQ